MSRWRALLTVDAVVNFVILTTCFLIISAMIDRRRAIGGSNNQGQAIQINQRADDIPGVIYAKANATIVLHLKSTCPFCTESMEFYRRLAARAKEKGDVQVVVVGTEPAEVLNDYLRDHDFRPTYVVSSQTRPQPTPTLITIDRGGVVRKVWLGQQSRQGEAAVLRSLDS